MPFGIKSGGYIEQLFILVVALGIIFTGEIFSFFIGEKTPGIYDSTVNYIPTPLPNTTATNNLQMLVQTYGKKSLFPPPPPGGNYCDKNYLAAFFGQAVAKDAACVCFNESDGGNPFATNNSCMTNCQGDPLCSPNGNHISREYSVGLFQANIYVWPSTDSKQYCPTAFKILSEEKNNYQCSLNDKSIFDYCVNDPKAGYFNPAAMIPWAVALYKTNGWWPWYNSAHYVCHIPGY